MSVTAPILHSDQVNDGIMVGENLSLAKGAGLLLDADVGAGKTEATMEAAVATNAAPLHAVFQGYVGRIIRALQLGATLGILTTANIQGASTLADLIAVTGADPNKLGGPLLLD